MKTSKLIFSSFKQIFKIPATDLPNGLESTTLPHFEEETLKALILEFDQIIIKEPTLLSLDEDVIIVGDLHGNLIDLLRIFAFYGLPPTTHYLFLGDYVDRGEFSIEVITLLMAIKCLYPTCVYLIRGNHEVESINKNYGFLAEISETYHNESLWSEFNRTFRNLSLACNVANQLFCVHGGISPRLHTLEDIARIKKPVIEIPELVDDLLWSDPTTHFALFFENDRGKGYKFGFQAANDFLGRTGLSLIIRAHECVEKGVDIKKNVITVFSSSNYAATANKAAILSYCNHQLNPIILPEIPVFRKADVSYFNVIAPKQGIPETSSLLSIDTLKGIGMSASTLKLIPSTKTVNAKPRIRIKSLTPGISRSSFNLGRKSSITVIPKLCPSVNCTQQATLPPMNPIQTINE